MLVAVSVCLGGGGVAGQTGCRRPQGWLDSAAPRVSLSSQRVVTISWSRDLLLSQPHCRHRWQIVVEKEGERREVCSGTTSARLISTLATLSSPETQRTIFRETDYFCTLDLSMRQYCGHQFSFYLTVLGRPDSGRLYSPQKSLLQLQCGGLSSVTVIKSSPVSSPQQGTCAGYKPAWILEPLFYRVDPINFRSVKQCLSLKQSN